MRILVISSIRFVASNFILKLKKNADKVINYNDSSNDYTTEITENFGVIVK